MAELFKHWFGRESTLKSISNKPIKTTTRDVSILIAVTLVITLLFMFIYHWAVDTPVEEQKWLELIKTTIINTAILGYAFEYLGVNNMIAESSIRYSRGTTLAKYASRREAMLYQCVYKLLNSPKYAPDEIAKKSIERNFRILKFIVNHPNMRGKIADAARRGVVYIKLTKYKAEYPKKIPIIELIETLPREILEAFDLIGDRISENIVYDIILHGFDGYTIADRGIIDSVYSTIENSTLDRANERGGAVARELAEPEDIDLI